MGKVQNIDPSEIYIINNEAQCVALSITTSIVDANDLNAFLDEVWGILASQLKYCHLLSQIGY